MSSHRVSDWDDARSLHKQFAKSEHKPARRVQDAASVHDPSGAGNAELVADDSGTIELDPAEIAAADAELAQRQDELAGYLRQAGQLASPLKDGSSPVAEHLRKAFEVRGSADGGVQATLQQYLDELSALRDAIHAASAGLVRQEDSAHEALGTLHSRMDDGGTA